MKTRLHSHKLVALISVLLVLIGCSLLGGDGLLGQIGHRYEQSLTLQAQEKRDKETIPTSSELSLTIHWDESVPVSLGQKFLQPGTLSWIPDATEATFSLSTRLPTTPGMQLLGTYHVVFALVAPFPTIADDVSMQELTNFWFGRHVPDFDHLWVPEEDIDHLVSLLGQPAATQVQIVASSESMSMWHDQRTWAIIPFDRLTPQWKVIQIDDSSPLSGSFDEGSYPLTVKYYLSGKKGSEGLWAKQRSLIDIQSSNRDPNLLASVIMTGVTALVRATADRMENKGILYPAEEIGAILRAAEITHISNEVAFNAECPLPDPGSISLRFCSRPEYIDLLVDIGVDVIELTGNHMNDWSEVGKDVTFELYQEYGMAYYGGGMNLVESHQPAAFSIHGNQIAFIGCNDPGPSFAWATPENGGSAPCEDYEWMIKQIAELKRSGFLVIATVQYHENYTYLASVQERQIYRSLANAGATIIQGSQAHTPKEMEFYDKSFIHFGLGNLFFDQMHYTEAGKVVSATREEFIDRYTFYNNKLISIELLTAMLEDYARPRLMTENERSQFLNEIFAISQWPTGD